MPASADITRLTHKARRLGMGGNFAAGHAAIAEAEALAGDDQHARAMCAIERGRLHNSAGEPALALPDFHAAWDLARQAGEHMLAVDAAHMVAIASDLDGAIEWTKIAMDYVAAHPDAEGWRGPLVNNLGWSYFDAGRYNDALSTFEEAVALRKAAGHPRELRIARYAVARTLRALGRTPEAIALGEELVRIADAGGEEAPFVYEELALGYAEAGDRDRAKAYAARALETLGTDPSFMRQEPQRLASLVELAGPADA